jgi:hypothetical protein
METDGGTPGSFVVAGSYTPNEGNNDRHITPLTRKSHQADLGCGHDRNKGFQERLSIRHAKGQNIAANREGNLSSVVARSRFDDKKHSDDEGNEIRNAAEDEDGSVSPKTPSLDQLQLR